MAYIYSSQYVTIVFCLKKVNNCKQEFSIPLVKAIRLFNIAGLDRPVFLSLELTEAV